MLSRMQQRSLLLAQGSLSTMSMNDARDVERELSTVSDELGGTVIYHEPDIMIDISARSPHQRGAKAPSEL